MWSHGADSGVGKLCLNQWVRLVPPSDVRVRSQIATLRCLVPARCFLFAAATLLWQMAGSLCLGAQPVRWCLPVKSRALVAVPHRLCGAVRSSAARLWAAIPLVCAGFLLWAKDSRDLGWPSCRCLGSPPLKAFRHLGRHRTDSANFEGTQ